MRINTSIRENNARKIIGSEKNGLREQTLTLFVRIFLFVKSGRNEQGKQKQLLLVYFYLYEKRRNPLGNLTGLEQPTLSSEGRCSTN